MSKCTVSNSVARFAVLYNIPRPMGSSRGDDFAVPPLDIAVIGIACRFPGAADQRAYWRNIEASVVSIEEVPSTRWDWRGLCRQAGLDEDGSSIRWGGFLNDIDRFDPDFFNISPREAHAMDPQQRILLQLAWSCLEDAGYKASRVKGTNVGIFVGICNYDYKELQDRCGETIGGHTLTGTANTIVPNRVSYELDLHGPSVSTDTACSSSLFAIHEAVSSLRNGECEMALAGGVNLLLCGERYVSMAKLGMLSSAGVCNTFDADADGYVRAEGAGLVLLKPLDRALHDRDFIYGVIKGSAVNHGGRARTLTSPNAFAQSRVVAAAWQQAGVPPETIGYIEAHGTGTPLGDPIEVHGLRRAFTQLAKGPSSGHPEKATCGIGSVKANIGHAEGAAGIAGVIKVLLAFQHGVLPGMPRFRRLNPRIKLEGRSLLVVDKTQPWERLFDDEGKPLPRRAGVSSFGFGGANAHVVFEELCSSEAPARGARQAGPVVVPLSAKNPERLQEMAGALASFLAENRGRVDLHDVAHTLQIGREAMASRVAVAATDLDALIAGLDAFSRNQPAPGVIHGEARKPKADAAPAQSAAGEGAAPSDLAPASIASHWVHGGDIDWSAPEVGAKGRRIPLPTYRFARERYWLQDLGRPAPAARERAAGGFGAAHPSVGRSCPQHGERCTLLELAPSDPRIRDHVVEGRPVAPAALVLDFVVAIARAGGQEQTRLRDVSWIRPLRIDEATLPCHVELTPCGDELTFEIFTQSSGAARQVFGSGTLALSSRTGGKTEQERRDVVALEARCNVREDAGARYRALGLAGLDYGATYRVLRQLSRNDTEALATLQAPQHAVGDAAPSLLRPDVLDGSLQAVSALLDLEVEGAPLPAELAQLEVFAPLPHEGFAHVVRSGAAADRFDLEILDGAGHVCAKLDGLTILRRRAAPMGLFYRPTFRPLGRSDGEVVKGGEGSVLLVGLAPQRDLMLRIAAVHGGQQARTVVLGDRTAQSSPHEWTLAPADSDGLQRCLDGLGSVRAFYFLGALVDPAQPLADLDELKQSQLRGALTFLRFVQALDRRSLLRDGTAIRAFTNGAFAVSPTDEVVPHSASLVGLALSVAREHPALHVTCTDLPAVVEASAELVGAMTRSDLAANAVTAVRGGVHSARVLEPLRVEPGELKLRQRGVYLILGGASGIGLETAVLFAERARARVAVLGRRPLDAEISSRLERVRGAGGEVLYCQADGASRADMERAVRQIWDAFGPINGVVHSAVELADRPLESMDEAAFWAALAPKVQASVVLSEVTEREPLDFMLFYSSAISYRGNAGQGNYAAGCTFQEALAARLRKAGRRVKVISWGYWGETGVVAGEVWLRKLARLGIQPISPGEGIDALARILSAPIEEVVALRADRTALADFGVSVGGTAGDPPAARAPDVREGALDLSSLARASEDAPELSRQAQAFRELEELGCLGLLDALEQMRAFGEGTSSLALADVRERISLAPGFERLVSAMLELLRRAGHVIGTGQSLHLGDHAKERLTLRHHQELLESFSAFEQRHPDFMPHARLLRACLSALPSVLRGERPATDVLFAAETRPYVERVYREGAVGAYGQCAASAVRKLVAQRAGGAPAPIRLIEVGAGTGGTTGHVLAALSGSLRRVEYVYTDVSPAFLRLGEERFGPRYASLRFAGLDIEVHPGEQGFARGSADIVLAANVLHATRDVAETLRHLKWLLADGGQLLFCETRAVQFFTTLTFGLLDGWWRFEDPERRLPHSPLLDIERWQRELREQGFRAVQAACITSDQHEPLAQCLIAAESDGTIAAPCRAAPTPSISQPHRPEARRSEPAPSEAGSATTASLQAAVLEKLIAVLARAIQSTPSSIDAERPFAEHGVDSIVAADVAQGLSKAFGLPLKTTSLFEFTTTAALAEHLCATYPAELRARLGVEERPAAPDRGGPPVRPSGADHGEAPVRPAMPRRGSDTVRTAARMSRGSAADGETCRGVMLHMPGSIDDVHIEPVVVGPPGPREVQIRVHAFALNFGDLLCVLGLYPTMPEYPFVPGFEVSGTVYRVGAQVEGLQVGDEVVALTGAALGGHAALVNTPAEVTVKKPRGLGFPEAAALPVAFVTAHAALQQAAPVAGERILIQTAAGGVGSMAIQLAQARGLEIFATAGSAEKCEYLRRLGVAHAINYRATDFSKAISERTGGQGIDIVLNMLPGDALQKGLDLLAPGGRYIEIAMTALRQARAVDLSRLIGNQSIHSIDLRRTLLSRPERVRGALEEMVALVEAGRIQPNVGRTFEFQDWRAAYRYLDAARNVGKVVVSGVPLDREPAVPSSRAVNRSAGPMGRPEQEPIAIIGASGRFPGAADLSTFWRNIATGVCSVTRVLSEDWPIAIRDIPGAGGDLGSGVEHGGFLEDIDRFDPLFFRISGAEATLMDPQQRLFLEECWKALEDAVIAPSSLDGQRCGVFLGTAPGDYADVLGAAGERIEAHTFIGNEASINAARIAYLLNLKGPTLAIGTACSSSLVALHYACQSLRSGECDLALVGGVFVNTTPRFHVLSGRAGMLSPGGRCRTFDEGADGFVPGEGVGVLVLKPLARALEDRDLIRGVITATGVNQDGRTSGITAPSGASQAVLLESVYKAGGIDPGTIELVECHGTGTPLGDPIEIEALTRAFRAKTDKVRTCAVGSVKTNIGHAVTAAGVAGVLKVLLALEHQELPPSLHFERPNPRIDFESSPFFVNTELKEWRPSGHPRRAAVSSFGFSGTNAHVVVEEPPPQPARAGEADRRRLFCFCLSAASEEALRRRSEDLLDWLRRHGREHRPGDVSFTLLAGRSHHAVRLCIVASDLDELTAHLEADLAGRSAPRARRGARPEDPRTQALDNDRCRRLVGELRNALKEGAASCEAMVEQLAELYVRGAKVDAGALFQSEDHRRVRLPTYPFARERHWPRGIRRRFAAERRAPLSGTHPFVDRGLANGGAPHFAKTFTPADVWVRDHIVWGQPVLPGAVFLEMARAAAAAAGAQVRRISKAAWLHPLPVTTGPVEAHIELKPVGNGFHCQITSGQDRALNVEMQLSSPPVSAPPPLDLASIRLRLSDRLTGDACRTLLLRQGLAFGPTFCVLDEVLRSGDEALATLKADRDGERGADGLVLLPPVIDGAWQALVALLPGEESASFRPFSLEELTWYDTLGRAAFAHITVKGADGGRYRRFALTFVDRTGQVLAEMTGFTVARADAPSRQGSSREPRDTDGTSLFFEPLWRGMDLKADPAARAPRRVLVLDDDGGLSNALAARVGRSSGAGAPAVERISFSCGDRDEEATLQRAIDVAPPELIVVHWPSPAGRMRSGEDAEKTLRQQGLTMYRLSRALARTSGAGVRLMCVRAGGTDAGAPLFEALGGLFRTLVLEHPACTAQLVELKDAPGAGPEALADVVLREWGATAPLAREIQYVGGLRQVYDLAGWQPPAGGGDRSRWRKGGVYVITGGAGGIGGAFAEHLVREAEAHVVLLGRSELSHARQQWLDGIRRLGGGVTYHRVDVTRREEVRAAVERTRDQLGALHGVLHAAGTLRDGLLVQKSERDITEVVMAKVLGAVHLDEAIGDGPLDLFLLFSSLAGLTGNAGQADYAYANRFLLSFAAWREALRKSGACSGRTLAVAWPLWAQGGFPISPAVRGRMAAVAGLLPMPTEAGLSALRACLERPGPTHSVMYGKDEAMRTFLSDFREHPLSRRATASLEPERTDSDALLAAAERLLKKRFAELLQIPASRLHPSASFETYGLDSMMATRITSRLEDDLGELPKTLLFEHQSLASLAHGLVEEHGPKLAVLVGAGSAAPAEAPSASPRPSDASAPSGGARAFEDIAVIGLAGRYPKAPDLDTFWQNLLERRDCIEEIPPERWDVARYIDADPSRRDRIYGKWGGFLADHDVFDPLFFHISPRDAEVMDPQERLFLEVAWAAVEDAGYSRSTVRRALDRHVGVFTGVMWSDYQLYGVGDGADGRGLRLSSSFASIANRVSFALDLNGPSMAVDTMCSSSLTAVILACQSLSRGECLMAIAGGVNLSLHPNKFLYLAQQKFLSSDGRCRAFGEGGDGYVPGEGAGALVLKPLRRAVADGDHIYGVIKGAAMNHGGMTHGYTVPSPDAQAALIHEALTTSGIDPTTLGYVEAHGTGTALGDPIELRALARALGGVRPGGSTCAVGSVKSNIGHLESAAGIAGLTKLLLQLRHRTLVPSIHADTLNRNIDFATLPLRVQREVAAWEPVEDSAGIRHPRRAGLSSFGAGGANAHVIIEEHSPEEREDAASPQLLPLSAATEERLLAYAQNMLSFLARARNSDEPLPPLADIAYTLQVGREQQDKRLAIIATDLKQWEDSLTRFVAGERAVPGMYSGSPSDTPPHDAPASEDAVLGAIGRPLTADELATLAKRWSSSRGDVNWTALHADRRPRRASLPTYPFARRRCWAPRRTAEDSAISARAPEPEAKPVRVPSKARPQAQNPDAYCIIGGGPTGIGTAKCLLQRGIPIEIIEREDDFGGVWNFGSSSGRVYESTHLISSKVNTQFSDYPMPEDYPHYPDRRMFLAYLRDMARHFDLYDFARLGTSVERIEPEGDRWRVATSDGDERLYRGVVIANGLQRQPSYPSLHGTFTGETLHSADYRSANSLRGKRVLIIGGGNSGCDIAVDVSSSADTVFHSMRRPYYFMPKFIEGRPTQEWLMDLPRQLGKGVDVWSHVRRVFKLAGFDPSDYGLQAPDYGINQAHPIINSHYLCHVGQGDIVPKSDVVSLDGQRVKFADGSAVDVDCILYATGYIPHFPFLDERHLAWTQGRPDLFLRIFHREHDNLFLVGFVNAPAGLGNVVNAIGNLLATYLRARERDTPAFRRFRALMNGPDPDLGGQNYIHSERHAFEVDLWKMIQAISFFRAKLEVGASHGTSSAASLAGAPLQRLHENTRNP
ncbi:SDR family NAD(P)-dependent oxidoreductase [Sorangium sp. So ce1014]|uniref:SDR family NAD(P)-dependent oxidoreductase n=1 Tax=Sorangium sp. So ce1014 TaxID=3133326 RepID=UPI003F5FA341